MVSAPLPTQTPVQHPAIDLETVVGWIQEFRHAVRTALPTAAAHEDFDDLIRAGLPLGVPEVGVRSVQASLCQRLPDGTTELLPETTCSKLALMLGEHLVPVGECAACPSECAPAAHYDATAREEIRHRLLPLMRAKAKLAPGAASRAAASNENEIGPLSFHHPVANLVRTLPGPLSPGMVGDFFSQVRASHLQAWELDQASATDPDRTWPAGDRPRL